MRIPLRRGRRRSPDETGQEAPEATPPTGTTTVRGRPSPRSIVITVLAVAVVVALAVVAVTVIAKPPASADASPNNGAAGIETYTVGRGDLTERVRTKGNLGFAAGRDLGTTLPGIVTSMQPPGTAVTVGNELFRIDNFPVVLFHGGLPMWRAFADGMDKGPDIVQLEQNLQALGYFDREPDNEFTWRTEEAIKKWQKDIGVEVTGVIAPGQIVFLPSDVRVADQKVAVGAAASPAILSVSGTVKQVTVNLDTNLATLATPGATVSVVLPDGSNVEGTIESVGAPEEKDDGAGNKKLKLPTVVSLGDPAAAASLNNVTVTVVITKVKSTNALLVPVLALLAKPGGGSAVEVLRDKPAAADGATKGSTTEQVTVELGAFADGMVEVTSGDLAEGDKVVVGK